MNSNATPRSSMTPTELLQELREPSSEMGGLSGLKTRLRPLVCPLHVVLEQIPMGARIFDIGCGSGSLLYLAVRLRAAKSAHGYDVSHDAIKAAGTFARRSDLVCAKFLPVSDFPNLSGYDVVTLVDVLHHIPPERQTGFLAQIVHAMDTGAKLVILDINADRVVPAMCNQIHDLVLNRDWVHPMRPRDVVAALDAVRARVDSPTLINTLWYSHYLISAYKP
jgi:2-polyprenyl-3-methyl-5-hydroxy-6-metoxy-1,4-benzoquinol methylase